MSYMSHSIRGDFPILSRQAHGAPLVYLDSAATTQKPQAVIDAVRDYYTFMNSNVHRAAHALADEATAAFEAARDTLQRFLNAREREEIIFTRGTTEAINLVANSLPRRLQAGDEILITQLEHHANIVPWQMLAERSGAHLVACDINPDGDLDLEDFQARLGPQTALVAVGHVSNALGTVNPIQQIIEQAHLAGALVLIDGAQAVAHLDVDVQTLDCDFYAFSSHKAFGPTGIGVLYGKRQLLEEMPPWQGGGEMIEHVTIERTTYNQLPYKFEAGTPHIAGAVGFGAAIDYLTALPRRELLAEENRLLQLALSELKQIEGIRLIGEPDHRLSIISFLLDGAHPNDVGTLLDQQGVAVRTGHHCAMPLMQRLGVPGTIRASFSLYNCEDDVDKFIAAIRKAKSFI
jgi:cysteine desulfurase/selenocysteine lyase